MLGWLKNKATKLQVANTKRELKVLIDHCEKTNKDLLNHICNLLDIYCPKSYKHNRLIKYVNDRPGHDKRYSINSKKISNELGWKRKYSFEKGIEKTVKWYLYNTKWWGDNFEEI